MRAKQTPAVQDARSIRREIAACLHDNIGQHLVGSMLAAKALANGLAKRHAPEATDAEKLFKILLAANEDIGKLIVKLDAGRPR